MRGESRLFILAEPFRFRSTFGVICVPTGFVTDGASIPRLFWNIFQPFGKHFGSAVIHDYNYSKYNTTFTRKKSDDIFLEGMKVLGVGFVKRGTIFAAVRMFGWTAYKGFKK